MKISKLLLVCFFSIFLISPAFSSEANPFTAKGEDEFTKHDKEKLENDIRAQIESSINQLERSFDAKIKDKSAEIEKTKAELERVKKEQAEDKAKLAEANVKLNETIEKTNVDIDGKIKQMITDAIVTNKSSGSVSAENLPVSGDAEDGTSMNDEILGKLALSTQEEKEVGSNRLENATFIGCFDKQVLFRDNETKEQFFVEIDEVMTNEEFNKMGGCSF